MWTIMLRFSKGEKKRADMNTSNQQQTYLHKVNKSAIPTCEILGVHIAAINMDWLLSFTGKHIQELSGDYMCVSNVHTTVTSYEDEDYRRIQNSGIMAIPDGGPLSTVGRKRGYTEMQRTTGPAYMEEILKISEDKGYRHYFYGGTSETLQKMEENSRGCILDCRLPGCTVPPSGR